MTNEHDTFEEEQQGSVYPDLSPAIDLVRSRLKIVAEDRHPLLEKWLTQLEKIETEMRHLERIEGLTSILTQPTNKQDDS